MHEEEVNGNWWTIPARRNKSKRDDRVYLTDSILRILPNPNQHGFYFPKVNIPDAPVSHSEVSDDLTYAVTGKIERWKERDPVLWLDKEAKVPFEPFTPHDFRRTLTTYMASKGFTDPVLDAILNHGKKKLKRTYNKYQYDTEKKQIMVLWDQVLFRLITKEKPKVDNVIPLFAIR